MLGLMMLSYANSVLTAPRTHSSPSSGHPPAHPVAFSTAQPIKKKPFTTRPPITSPEVARFIQDMTPAMLTPAQKTSSIMAAAIKRDWKLDVDPDTARVVTLNYNVDHPKPRNGKVLNSMTLTQTALNNVRSLNTEDEHDPTKKMRHSLQSLGHFMPLIQTGLELEEHARLADVHEYVFKASDPATGDTYRAADKLPFTPAAFRELVWQTELSEPYKSYLDKFWPAHQQTYTQLSRLAFGSSAQLQLQEGSLSNYEASLAMRAAGYGGDKRLQDLTVADVKAPPVKDPNVETGLLSINGDQSTDLIYVTDKQMRFNAKGKRIHHTLLYIPGNSSPLHRFDSVSQMKTWLADQAADPAKRAALAAHFKKNDQDDKTFSDGVKQSLTGLGGWTQAQQPNKLGFTSLNAWDPQQYITTHPVDGDPFQVMAERQKTRAYADADHDIVTDRDVTKQRIISVAEAAATAALMLTPLALVIPEVAIALDATYVVAGVAELAVGIDDATHGKSTAIDRSVFGLLNAVPPLLHGAGKLSGGSARLEGEAALAGANPQVRAPLEFNEVVLPGESTPEHQVVELAGDNQSGNGVKRTRLDEASEEGSENLKRSKSTDEVRDLNKINDLIFTFVDRYNGQERLNIVAHGVLGDGGTADMLVAGEKLNSDDLLQMLWDNNVPTDEYANIRLLMCNSGTGGEASFAAQFQRDVGVPVKAYEGKVSVDFNLDELAELFAPSRTGKTLTQFEGVLPRNLKHRVVKIQPQTPGETLDAGSQHASSDFSYKPVHIPGRAENPKPLRSTPSVAVG